MTVKRNPVGAPLVQLVPARAAVEALKQQPPALLAKHQREERLSHKVVRDARRYHERVEHLDRNLTTLERANVYVPVDGHVLGRAQVHAADLAAQVAKLHRLG